MALDQDRELVNLGLPGTGNVSMMHRMLQCDIVHQPSAEDWVCVLWTTWPREDRIIADRWWHLGNVLTYAEHKQRQQDINVLNNVRFIKHAWNEDWDVIKNCTAIITAQKILPITTQATVQDLTQLYPQHVKYQSRLPKMLYIDCDSVDHNRNNYDIEDTHPGIIQQATICKRMLQTVGIQDLQPSTWQWVMAEEDRLKNNPPQPRDIGWKYDPYIDKD